MNDKTIKKLILDIGMTILFLLMIDPKNTGMPFHEIAGLTMGALFIYHIFLNWSWVKKITQNLFNPKLKTKPKLFYLLDIVSFISVVTIIVTGIQISQVLFVSETVHAGRSLFTLHKWVSYFCLGLFGVHIAVHRRFIVNAAAKLFSDWKSLNLGKAIMSAGAIVLIIGLLYSQIACDADRSDQVGAQREPSAWEEAYQSEPGDSRNSISADNGSESPMEENQESSISADTGSKAETKQDQSISSDSGNAGGTDNTVDTVTLSDYLDKLFCNGCPNHCSLLAPQCNKGVQQQEYARIEYQQQYGDLNLD